VPAGLSLTDGGLTWKESKERKNESIHAMTQSPIDREHASSSHARRCLISRHAESAGRGPPPLRCVISTPCD